MAGNPEAADDLIAELTKLMAQDAKPQPVPPRQPAPPEPAHAPFSLRIPGGEAPPPPGQAAAPRPPVTPTVTPAVSPAPAQQAAPRFDFNPSPAPTPPAPAPQTAPAQPAPVQSRPAQPTVAAVAVPAEEHDSIADLIAAELAADAHPQPTPPSAAPAPVATAPRPAPKDVPPSAPPATAAAPQSEMPAASPAAPAAPQPAAERPTPPRPTNLTPVNVSTASMGQERPSRPGIRPVNLQPTSRPEVDQFKVPPVFGLGTTPAPAKAAPAIMAPVAAPPRQADPQPAPPATRPVFTTPAEPEPSSENSADPIDEIESLIGRAVRVELDSQRPAAAVNAPVRPAPAARVEPAVAAPTRPSGLSSVDEAILLAAEATGAQVGWVDANEPAAPVARQRAERPARRFAMTKALAGPLVAVTLLLAAGFGLYWALGLGHDSGPAPLLTADAGPVKEVPAVEPDTAAEQQSVVFNEIDGVVPGAEEQLVSRDQANVNEVTQVAVPEVSEEGLANRKVRTVTVRPDGTIVSGEDSVAGSAILPVDRPVVPEVPGAETASPALTAAADATTTTPTATTVPETTTTPTTVPGAADTPLTGTPATTAALPTTATELPAATPTTPATPPVVPGSTVPVVDASGATVAGKTAPVPMLRPSGLSQTQPSATAGQPSAPTSPVNAVVDAPLAALPPAPTDTAPSTITDTTGPLSQATEVTNIPDIAPAYVQLASQRSEEEARQTASALITRYGPLFGGANMEVQRIDLGARGIYYRVRVPAGSVDEANNICTNVKAAGGDCFTM